MSLNIEHIAALRDLISSMPDAAFDHGMWTRSCNPNTTVQVGDVYVCGTSACIAGWAVVLGYPEAWRLDNRQEIEFDLGFSDFERLGREYLGLDYEQARVVFYPFDIDYEQLVDAYDMRFVQADLFKEKIRTASNTEAVQFLTKMLQEKTVDINWWMEIIN